MSSYFPNRWPLSYLNLTKNMKTYKRRQQHKNFKHQDIKQKEPPQKYRLGTISNTKLLADPATTLMLHNSTTVIVMPYMHVTSSSLFNVIFCPYLRGCQLSKTNTCMFFTCTKKNDNFTKNT